MTNVNYDVSKDKKTLTIIVDLTQEIGPSGSGKSIVIASTQGNQQILPNTFLGLNLYRKNK